MSASSTSTRGKLTPHQREVYDRLVRISRRRPLAEGEPVRYVWVNAGYVGSRGACVRLVEKGWIEVQSETGPRGGVHYEYRPVAS
jgi:hypothetical protein